MSEVRLELEMARQRRLYTVAGASAVKENVPARRKPGVRMFVPTMAELEIRDEDMVIVWVYGGYPPSKARGCAMFSNYDANIAPLSTAPDWLLNLVEQVVPNWKGIDNA